MSSLKMILIVGLGLAPAENGTDKSVPYKLDIERNEQAFYNYNISNDLYGCKGKGIHIMKALEDKIIKEGQVVSDSILKVGSFLNQQLDPIFMHEMGKEIHRLFKDCGVTKVLTIEASGIAIALAAAYYMGVPAVFAKKSKSSNVAHDVLTANVKSFTRGINYEICVSSEYITKDDTVLIVDDFLASGNAICGLIELTESAGAKVAGVSVAIEKGFQKGGDSLRERGIKLESLAIVDEMSENSIKFR